MERSTKNDDVNETSPALQILEVPRKGEMKLKHERLKKILCHPYAEGLPIAVISVVGAYRTGKSFLMNFILRYLHNRGYNCPTWIGGREEKLVGFKWRGGRKPITAGIWMWNEPIIAEKSGKKIAIFLADCEGHFGVNSDKLRSKISLVTCLLLSSLTILNISQRMHDNDTEFLELCVQYSQRTDEGKLTCPLQDLYLLVRDWNCPVDRPDGLPYGEDDVYKREVLDTNPNIEEAFRTIKCYLMPEPSYKTRQGACDGELKKIETEDGFVQRMKEFCERVANPGNLKFKENFTGHSLMNFVISNFDVMVKNSNPILEAKTRAELAQDVETAELFYNRAAEIGHRLDQELKKGDMDDEQLKSKYEKICRDVLGEFRKDIQFLVPEVVKRLELKLRNHVYLKHFKRGVLANGVAKMINRNAGENALHLVAAYRLGMEEAMKDVRATEWEVKLHSRHKENLTAASGAFEHFSEDPLYQEGLKMLSSGIECAFGLMKIEGSLKKEFIEYERKKMVCDSVHEYEETHTESSGEPQTDFNKFIAKMKDEVRAFELKRRAFDEITTYSKNISEHPRGENLEEELKGIKIKHASETFDTLGYPGDFARKVDEIHDLLEEREKCVKALSARIRETAAELVSAYRDGMTRIMEETEPHDWSKLESSHKENLDSALTSFQQYSSDAEFEKGRRFLLAGVRFERGLIALGRSFMQDIAAYQRKKTICDCIDGYTKNVKEGAKGRSVQDIIAQIRHEAKRFELKQKLFEEIDIYSKRIEIVLHGKDLDRKFQLMTNEYKEQARVLEDPPDQELFHEIAEMLMKAFALFLQRDKNYEPFRLRLLKLDKAVRESMYVDALTRRLDDGYATPEVFDAMHEELLAFLLPPAPEDCSTDAVEHRKKVKKALNKHKMDFKKWNEENKSIFKRRVGLTAGGLGVLGAGGAAGGAVGLYFAEIAIITTVGAAVGAGVGAGIGAVALVIVGGILTYKFIRKKAREKHFKQKSQKISDKKENIFRDESGDH